MQKDRGVLILSDQFAPDNLALAVGLGHLFNTIKRHGYKVRVITSKRNDENEVTHTIPKPVSNLKSFAIRFLYEVLFGLEMSLRILFRKNVESLQVVVGNPGRVLGSSKL